MVSFEPEAPFHFFDPDAARLVIERQLPHWAQAGTLCFITWRTWDSMPQSVIKGWLAERDAWLNRHGIDPMHWQSGLDRLDKGKKFEFQNRLAAFWLDRLDECHGACVLRRPELAHIVAESLKKFDGDRYTLADFVVMPNHLQLIAAFANAEAMVKQCYSWKHFTSVQINKVLGRQGRFWEVDSFDHLVRSAEQFQHLRAYIADNPRRAGLRAGEFACYSREVDS